MQCNFQASSSDKMYLCDSNFVVSRLLFVFILLIVVSCTKTRNSYISIWLGCFMLLLHAETNSKIRKWEEKNSFWLFRSFACVFAVNGNSVGFHALYLERQISFEIFVQYDNFILNEISRSSSSMAMPSFWSYLVFHTCTTRYSTYIWNANLRIEWCGRCRNDDPSKSVRTTQTQSK